MNVYLVEEGEYEDRAVVLVADSVEAAVAAIKATFPVPYVVTWGDHVLGPWKYCRGWVLSGQFALVPGYSTEHVASFTITPYPLHRAAASLSAPRGLARSVSSAVKLS